MFALWVLHCRYGQLLEPRHTLQRWRLTCVATGFFAVATVYNKTGSAGCLTSALEATGHLVAPETKNRSTNMTWIQRTIRLRPRSRGCHLITDEIVGAIPELAHCQVGLLHLFLQHTSASLTINENADPDVRHDLEVAFNHIAPEDLPYRHTIEGPDDMPAHVKAAMVGNGLSIPVTAGRLALGTWQGITLFEHRDRGGSRSVVLTLQGEP